MIFESKKGRTKVLGSKSSINSYFSRSGLIFGPSPLCYLIFITILALLQKLCQNWLLFVFPRCLWLPCVFLNFFVYESNVPDLALPFVSSLWHKNCFIVVMKLRWCCQCCLYRKPRGRSFFRNACETENGHVFVSDFEQIFRHVLFVTVAGPGFAISKHDWNWSR